MKGKSFHKILNSLAFLDVVLQDQTGNPLSFGISVLVSGVKEIDARSMARSMIGTLSVSGTSTPSRLSRRTSNSLDPADLHSGLTECCVFHELLTGRNSYL